MITTHQTVRHYGQIALYGIHWMPLAMGWLPTSRLASTDSTYPSLPDHTPYEYDFNQLLNETFNYIKLNYLDKTKWKNKERGPRPTFPYIPKP
jgi:hypothetical protein